MSRRMVRCLDGHPYDANAHDSCPVCGAAPMRVAGAGAASRPDASGEGRSEPDPAPPPPWRRRAAFAVLGLGLVVGGGLAIDRLRPVDCARPDMAESGRCAAETRQRREAETRAREVAEEARRKDAAARRETEARQADASARQARAEADRAVAAFAAAAGSAARVRAAYAPLDPADVEPLLDTLSPLPFAEGQLRLSRALRHGLVLTRALRAFRAGQTPVARTLLTGLSKAVPPEPDRPVAYGAYALGFILATTGGDPADMAAAAFHLRVASELGLAGAVIELLRRPNLVTAARIDDPGAARLLDTAAIQNGQSAALEDLYKRRGLNPLPAVLLAKAFRDALTAGDRPALIAAYRAIGERRAPLIDADMAYAIASTPGFDGPYERILAMADGGAAAMQPRSYAVIGWLCETGGAGLPKDIPNAALWTALALVGTKPEEPSFPDLRKRYAGLKDALPPGQRTLVEQVAKEIGLP
ncbi:MULTISPECIES: hypothetical protein [Methylobacteriaceae]|jgi:hypothetical protein|uniref:Uncharacterized protein n=3 Tax=Methylobacteriaceae TaxID=119045 RepID=A0A160PCD0_9HYPH|nr:MULTISPECIES: hypothetical protein [Methylobacteriaceae]RUP02550.1 MAG: hypothetical protein EKK34_23475 [Mycobacterium sp.]BAU89051.1 hypothetical protein MPPM_0446 [Methylorubrum populi]GJE28757.1 hypothetical protein LKMONMHP_3631 [Methylobacterium organophilum]